MVIYRPSLPVPLYLLPLYLLISLISISHILQYFAAKQRYPFLIFKTTTRDTTLSRAAAALHATIFG